MVAGFFAKNLVKWETSDFVVDNIEQKGGQASLYLC